MKRAFGVLHKRFAIVWYPTLTWSESQMWEVINACVIMHSMNIESEPDAPTNDDHHFYFQGSLAKAEQVLA
jgi:hypothetical protein